LPQLSDKEHSLVHNRSARERNHIRIITALFKNTSHYIESPVEIKSTLHFFRSLDKRLHDARHTVNCCFPKYIRMHRHLSPAEEVESFLLCDHFKNVLFLISFQFILRKEKHTHSVIS